VRCRLEVLPLHCRRLLYLQLLVDRPEEC
jgi:hypothetical protein